MDLEDRRIIVNRTELHTFDGVSCCSRANMFKASIASISNACANDASARSPSRHRLRGGANRLLIVDWSITWLAVQHYSSEGHYSCTVL